MDGVQDLGCWIDNHAHKCTIEAHEEKIGDSKNNNFPAYSRQKVPGYMSAIRPFICYDEGGTLGCAESGRKDSSPGLWRSPPVEYKGKIT